MRTFKSSFEYMNIIVLSFIFRKCYSHSYKTANLIFFCKVTVISNVITVGNVVWYRLKSIKYETSNCYTYTIIPRHV